MTPERAVTLVELLVVLVLLGIMAGLVALTVHTARPPAPTDPVVSAVNAARDSAIQSGHTVTVTLPVGGAEREVTAGPDGHVLADSALHVDPLTGRPNAVP
ncbi:MAG TPA: prepilin-type N-terminal cleavage/methylation domain-containing protein [Gemmatimonadaceae bacterium]|nr:prepilin-type N-terminal cleavage/methylation domain-containing protein [Gemmatimonadaceae bacterium]